MRYWIFKCSPDQYLLERRLEDRNPKISWTVTRYKDLIQAGDTIFVWQTGPRRGFRAILVLTRSPRVMRELKNEQKYNIQKDTESRLRVVGVIKERVMDLPHPTLRNTPGLESLSVFHGFQQTTNFKMTKKQAKIVLGLHTKNPNKSPEPTR